jgi:TolB-like protein
MKKISLILLTSVIIALLGGCADSNINPATQDLPMTELPQINMVKKPKTPYISKQSKDLNKIIIDIANQLESTNTIDLKNDKGTIAVTSFVNLNSLSKTSKFGRLLGESMLNELFSRNFYVSDFRGRGVIYVNQNGEFYITRKVSKLQTEVPNSYVLVGTYSKIGINTFLNVRILNNTTGKVVASARAIYNQDYCKLSPDMCIEREKRKIKIVGQDF